MYYEITVNGVKDIAIAFDAWGHGVRKGVTRLLAECGEDVKDLAVDYCPISPTQSQTAAERQRKRLAREAKRKAILSMREYYGKAKPKHVKATAPSQRKKKAATAPSQRKKKAAPRSMPGTLARSIQCESDEEVASVFIASNAASAAYAAYIHDQKNNKWFNRGIGTVAKGMQADEKFIERAMDDLQPQISKKFEDFIGGASL